MRLTSKLTIGLVVAILPVIAVSAGVRADREITASEADLRDDDVMLGRTLAGAMLTVWRSAGEADARLLITGANEPQRRVTIRFVRLDPRNDRDAPFLDPAQLVGLVDGHPWVVRNSADTLLTYVAMSPPDGHRGALELRRSLVAEQSFIHHAIRHAATATGTVVGLCGCIALALGVVLVGKPVNRLVAQTRRIGAGDLTKRLRPTQRDELGQLGREIDTMCDHLAEAHDHLAAETAARIAALDQVRHSDRLATVGKLAAGIAHELGTPLNVISGHAQLVTESHEPGSADHDNASIVISQTKRISAIIRQLLDFARRSSPRRATFEIGPVVRETVALLGPMFAARHVEIAIDTGDEVLVASIDRGQLQQALANLVVNALQASREGGLLGITVTRSRTTSPSRPGAATDHARIEVTDSGTGISAEVLPHIFEPFFTTKDTGQGTGLGLAVTYGIVEEHDGWLEVSSTLGEGSRFAVLLPLERPTHQRKAVS